MNPLMKAARAVLPLALLVSFIALPSAVAAGQETQGSTQMTAADIQRLETAVYDANAALERLRSQNPERADQLQARLDELRDEVTYLKVKQRKKEGASRSEYGTLRDHIDDVRIEARNAMQGADRTEPARGGVEGGALPPPTEDRPSSGSGGGWGATKPGTGSRTGTGTRDRTEGDTTPARQGKTSRPNEVPAGTEIDVRLETALSSSTAQVEDRFNATTMADLYNGSRVLIPSGSSVRGVVTAVNKAGRVDRTGKLTLSFDRVTVNGRSYPLNGTVTEALQSGGYRQDAGKIGGGAAVGAILGGILGGLKGALAGILIGGGGVVAATEGQDVNLPAGTVLRIRLESPVTIGK